jgi:hypothetical protein
MFRKSIAAIVLAVRCGWSVPVTRAPVLPSDELAAEADLILFLYL